MAANDLLEKIKDIDENAASELKKAGLTADAELQSLTQEDLRELLPGISNLKKRKAISHIIYKQKSVNAVMKELMELIYDEYLSAAPSRNEVLVDYLNILKDLRTQMNKILDAHISPLEEITKSQPPQDQDKGRCGSSTSSLLKTVEHPMWGQKTQVIVTYKMVVSGQTFDAHLQLLEKIKTSSGESDLILLEECQSGEDCQVVIVFCPVVSRVGTDAESALKKVTDHKPVILVLMHHLHTPTSTGSVRTWDTSCNVALCVHVFYHETVRGLLQCQENNAAINLLRQKLMSHNVKTSENTSENAEKENKSRLWGFLTNTGLKR